MFNLLLISLTAFPVAVPDIIDVFYKEMPPSQQTLEMVNTILSEFTDEYEIAYHLITDASSSELIQLYSLPDTHFPFAIAVNGRYTATIDGEDVFFVHFPLFMHGIGRHEGNWSMDNLRQVLTDNSLLNDQNTLPILTETDESTECLGEE